MTDTPNSMRPHEIVPNTDPSVMTTAQLDRTIVGLTENIAARFDAISTRLDGMDKATSVLHEDMVRGYPSPLLISQIFPLLNPNDKPPAAPPK